MRRKCSILQILLILIVMAITSCRGENSVSDKLMIPTSTATSTLPVEIPVVQVTTAVTPSWDLNTDATETATSAPPQTDISTPSPTIPPETHLRVECLDVLPEMPAGAKSNDVVVLGRYHRDPERRYETMLLEMNSGEKIAVTHLDEYQGLHIVSLDKTLIAYYRSKFEQDGNKISEEFIIATADGQIREVIPWEDNWKSQLLTWTTDQQILIPYDDDELREREKWNSVFAFLAYDSITGEQELLQPVFPGRLTNIYPYWDGWLGVKYDPTLTRAVVPTILDENEELYTYALWDLSTRELITSLESIFFLDDNYSIMAPQPFWSEDGASFVFVGQLHEEDNIKFEVFQVSRDGQVEQLTNLTPIYRASNWRNIWSPDGRKIAMIVDIQPKVDGDDILVLDIETKEIIDSCIPMHININQPEDLRPIIWSPDGQQFLVKDWLDDAQSRIILVDIEQGFAAEIAENFDLLGWMLASPNE